MKRLLALLLVAAMALSILPMTAAAAKCDTAEDLWQQIIQLENKKVPAKRGVKRCADDYAAIVDDVIALVEASSAYRKGTIERHGSFFFWETVDGEVCGYSPRTAAKYHNGELAASVQDAGIETVSYAKRGNNPDSKDVVVIEPFYGTDSSFTKQYQNEGNSIAKATGGTYTLYKTSAGTIDAIADALESSAVVIFDSHGDTDYAGWGEDYTSEANTSYLLLSTGTGLTGADKSKGTGEFGTYYHAYSSYGYYYVDGTAITNHMEKQAPNGLLWMAICLGMATSGLEKPMREHGVGVVYGYSQSVTFDGDYDYEATFWTQMKNGATVADAISTMKTKHGSWDPGMGCKSYSSAIRNYAAFPIVVSAQDDYPGHGNVDNYQTVTSDWTLFGSGVSYSFKAVSADESMGTVSVSGSTITASPKTGYEVSGYSVSPAGACKVTQNGNQFIVSNVTADCTVTISFTKTHTFTAVSADENMGTVSVFGSTIIAAPKQGYAVSGYSVSPEGACKVTQNGNQFTVSNVTADCTVTVSFTKVYTFQAVSADETMGSVSVSGNSITAKPKAGYLVDSYTVSPADACKVTQNGNVFYVSDITADCTITISFVERQKLTVSFVVPEGVICNALTAYAGEQIALPTPTGSPVADKYNYRFVGWTDAPYADNQMKPTYYSAGTKRTINEDKSFYALYCYMLSNKIRYTTELQSDCEHVWDKGTEQLAPTCTEPGKILYTCTVCGETRTEAVEALGHDYRVETIAPTETEQGYDLHTCARCGDEYMDNYTDPVPVTTCPCIDYTDVDREAWYHTAVDFTVENGLMGSTSTEELTFEPMTKVSRAMVASILYRIAGEGETVEYQGTFTDVKENAWYTGAIEWCAKAGLASGKGEGIFDPNGNVTRQELAMFFYKLAELRGEDMEELADLDTYPDGKTVPAWAKTALSWCVERGVISGKADLDGNVTLNPTDTAMRCELASILMRYLDN